MLNKKSYFFPLVIITMIFFVFGFIIWLNGILIPYFKICLELTNFQASLVVFAAYLAYFFMALPSAWILKFIGYKKGIIFGLLVMAFGTLLFIPASYTRIYIIFLLGLFITGTGLTLLQAAVNPYVAIIGPIESTAQRIGYLGLANKTAGIFSIMVLGSVFLLDADDVIARAENADIAEKARIFGIYAQKIIGPYIIITLILMSMAAIVFFSNLPEIDESKIEVEGVSKEIKHRSGVFKYPWLILGVITLFFATPAEIIPVDGIILYSKSQGISIDISRHFPTYTLIAMLLGYLTIIILVPKYLSQNRALQFAAIWGILLSCGSFLGGRIASIFCLILTGFATAMFWGTIWGLSLRGLGKYTKIGGAMLLMAIVGGSIFPLIFGRLIDTNTHNPQNAVLILIPFYLVIFAYSTWGYRLEDWSHQSIKNVIYSKIKL